MLKKPNRYKQKNNLFCLTWSTKSVREKINDLTCLDSRNRCIKAYEFLMKNELSSYKSYVELREITINNSKRFNMYDFSKNVGIECALWPNLYPTLHFCETALSGRDNRASTKVGFMIKTLSQISDYGTNYELLQFHYDLWHNYGLVDAVRQLGPLTLFITISPSELSFPLPPWLKNL